MKAWIHLGTRLTRSGLITNEQKKQKKNTIYTYGDVNLQKEKRKEKKNTLIKILK